MPVRLRLEVHESVVHQALEDIRRHPDIEVGGKFIGYVTGAFDTTAHDWRRQLDDLQVHVVAYLDAGPAKQRSAVHHLSDTDYQFRLFQEVIRDHPEVTFLGLWHSHHPNGLGTLSRGDEQTGTVTVNNPGHELDFLLSSLAVDFNGLRAGRHFVFVRGHTGFLEIDPACLRIVDGPNEVARTVITAAERLHSEHKSRSQSSGGRAGASSSTASAPRKPEPGAAAPWMATDWGKKVIADDQTWLRAHPGVRPFLRDGNLVWQGPVTALSVPAKCELTFPASFPDDAPVVELRTDDDTVVVQFTIPDVTHREKGFQAALHAFSGLLASAEATEQSATTADQGADYPAVPLPAGAESALTGAPHGARDGDG